MEMNKSQTKTSLVSPKKIIMDLSIQSDCVYFEVDQNIFLKHLIQVTGLKMGMYKNECPYTPVAKSNGFWSK